MARSAAASERTPEEEVAETSEIKAVQAENAEDLQVNASGADESIGEKTGTE